MRKYRKPRATQRANHGDADGHVPRSPDGHSPSNHGMPTGRLSTHPTANNEPVNFGPRRNHDVLRQSQITNERTRTNPHPLSRRMTKFIQNMRGQVRIPKVIDPSRATETDQQFGERCLDVGQVPED
jgi:hypothetical protein